MVLLEHQNLVHNMTTTDTWSFLFEIYLIKSVFLTFTACTCNVLLPEHIYIPYLNAIWEEEGCLAHCTVGEATPLPPRFAF